MFLFWLAYTSSFKFEEMLAGLVISIIIAYFNYESFSKKGFSADIFTRLIKLLIYIPVFIWEMIKANIDVARRVINPELPINPGIVAINTELKSDIGKMFLANSITLTPGTLTVDVIDDIMYIHWIDVKTDNSEKQKNYISTKFENLLKGVF